MTSDPWYVVDNDSEDEFDLVYELCPIKVDESKMPKRMVYSSKRRGRGKRPIHVYTYYHVASGQWRTNIGNFSDDYQENLNSHLVHPGTMTEYPEVSHEHKFICKTIEHVTTWKGLRQALEVYRVKFKQQLIEDEKERQDVMALELPLITAV